MSKKIIPVALLSSLTLIAGVAFAADPNSPANPEHSFTSMGVPVAKTRAEVLTELADFRKNPVSADRWKDLGGERGWALLPHRYDYVEGLLAHSAECDHSTPPKPSLSMSASEKSQNRELHRNSF